MLRDAALVSISGLPYFAAYFALALALLSLFLGIYITITPYREIELIRKGNVAAALSLSGALLGFAIPLASAIAHSVGLLDMLIWAAVALVVQLFAYFIVRLMVPAIATNVSHGEVASGVFLGSVAIALGLLSAASMSY